MKENTKRKVLVAMSGGVDSSATAALLMEQGYEVGGATIRTWASNSCESLNTRACCGLTGVEDARAVCDRLDIPYWVFNFEKEFKKHVVDYFASEYMKARTPNPCIACNEHIKFRLFLERARLLGFDTIATGHYAQLYEDPATGRVGIREGVDKHKDQSYVLFPLDQDVLQNLLLPAGAFSKPDIRSKAGEYKMGVENKPDSQEICFIPSHDYGAFLDRELAREERPGGPAVLPGKGPIRTKSGEVLGEHEGYHHYTIGQRRGLGVAHSEKLYVVDIVPDSNEVVVGTKQDVLHQRCVADRVNWFIPPEKEKPFPAFVKIRSQHRKAPATIMPLAESRSEIFFHHPQEAITPGQAAVIYDDDRVLGGGWISSERS